MPVTKKATWQCGQEDSLEPSRLTGMQIISKSASASSSPPWDVPPPKARRKIHLEGSGGFQSSSSV